MEFYVIPPLSQLSLMEEGDRIFVLAQLYRRSVEYRDYIKQLKSKGWFITLDNGAGDWEPVRPEELIECIQDLQPHEAIAPDILFDKKTTLSNFTAFLDKVPNGVGVFACPQGNTLQEWLECYIEMLPYADVIGLSKITVPWVMFGVRKDRGIAHSRNLMYNLLKEKGLIQRPLHLLGAGEPWEFQHYKGNSMIRSTDSCFTVWSAMNGISFKQDYDRIPTPKDYFDREMTTEQVELAKENIAFFRTLLP